MKFTFNLIYIILFFYLITISCYCFQNLRNIQIHQSFSFKASGKIRMSKHNKNKKKQKSTYNQQTQNVLNDQVKQFVNSQEYQSNASQYKQSSGRYKQLHYQSQSKHNKKEQYIKQNQSSYTLSQSRLKKKHHSSNQYSIQCSNQNDQVILKIKLPSKKYKQLNTKDSSFLICSHNQQADKQQRQIKNIKKQKMKFKDDLMQNSDDGSSQISLKDNNKVSKIKYVQKMTKQYYSTVQSSNKQFQSQFQKSKTNDSRKKLKNDHPQRQSNIAKDGCKNNTYQSDSLEQAQIDRPKKVALDKPKYVIRSQHQEARQNAQQKDKQVKQKSIQIFSLTNALLFLIFIFLMYAKHHYSTEINFNLQKQLGFIELKNLKLQLYNLQKLNITLTINYLEQQLKLKRISTEIHSAQLKISTLKQILMQFRQKESKIQRKITSILRNKAEMIKTINKNKNKSKQIQQTISYFNSYRKIQRSCNMVTKGLVAGFIAYVYNYFAGTVFAIKNFFSIPLALLGIGASANQQFSQTIKKAKFKWKDGKNV